jgi:hypothetical protein
MSDYGTASRRKMMQRYEAERRIRKIRRIGYHLMDCAGFVLWGLVGIIAAACTVFLIWHR